MGIKAIGQHAAKIELKNIQEFHDLEHMIKEKRYPNLPEEFEDGAKNNNPNDYKCLILIKYILEHELLDVWK